MDCSFFNSDTVSVAKQLIGMKLIREYNGASLSGTIVETEAYLGDSDTACHSAKGRTERTEVMFGPAGRAYIYLIYGMYHMLNVVTEKEGVAHAVLIRAIDPVDGTDVMRDLRGAEGKNITNGPGKLCQALSIDKTLNGKNLLGKSDLWLEPFRQITEAQIESGPRIGINYADEKDRNAPLRFWLKRNRYVSKGR